GKADQAMKVAVEKAAIASVWALYEGLGDTVESVESENCGWDLETGSGLRIEVKGRSGPVLSSELSPNEYRHFLEAERTRRLARTYRIAVVANALSSEPSISILRFEDGQWTCELSGKVLQVQERVAASFSVIDP